MNTYLLKRWAAYSYKSSLFQPSPESTARAAASFIHYYLGEWKDEN
jgi:hypothetical protein